MADDWIILANQLYGTGNTTGYFRNTEYEALIYGSLTPYKIIRGLLDNELWTDRERNPSDLHTVLFVRNQVIKKMAHMLKYEPENFIEKINLTLRELTKPERVILQMRFSRNLTVRAPAVKSFTVNEPIILTHWIILEALIADVNRYEYKQAPEKNESVYCDCGGNFTYNNRLKHQRTKKHIEYNGGKILEGDLILCCCGIEVRKYNYVRHIDTINHNYRLKLLKQR